MAAPLLILVVAGVFSLAALPVSAGPPTVTVTGEVVSVEATEASLVQVLGEIGERTGAKVLIESALADDLGEARVSAAFIKLALDEALRRLLQGRNFVLLYGPKGVDEIRVYLDGRTGYRELSRAGLERTGPETRSRRTPPAEPAAAMSPPPLPEDAAALARLRRTALTSPDAAARIEALETLVEVEDPARLADTVVEGLSRERDSRVLATLLEVANQRHEVIPASAFRDFAGSDHDGAARVTALELLVQYNGSDAATRTGLGRLAQSDASSAVRDAARSLLDHLDSPPAKLQDPSTMLPGPRPGTR